MTTKKLVEAEMENLTSLKGMVEAYQEIAASRIRKTRDSVLKSRIYLTEVNSIFQQVKTSYRTELEEILKKGKIKDISKISFLKKNGKTVSVFIASSTGLYGEIVRETFDLFLKEVKNQKTDAVIIGRLGLSFFEKEKVGIKPYFFDLPDWGIEAKDLFEIAKLLLKYEKIRVFYSRFQSVVKQEPVFEDISGNLAKEEKTEETLVKYLFEPSLQEILGFFEGEIFSSIFEQTVKESSLAKFASRLISLMDASENIKKGLKNVIMEKERIRHSENNKKQLQTLTSLRLWRQA